MARLSRLVQAGHFNLVAITVLQVVHPCLAAGIVHFVNPHGLSFEGDENLAR